MCVKQTIRTKEKRRDKKLKGINQGKHDIHLGMKDQLSVPLCVLDNNLEEKNVRIWNNVSF